LEKRTHVTRDVTCVLSIMTRTGTMMTKQLCGQGLLVMKLIQEDSEYVIFYFVR